MNDLKWWTDCLSSPLIPHPIPAPTEVFNVQAFSDASSSTGLTIIIEEHWQTWILADGWKTNVRDITWAEAISFEFLVDAITQTFPNLKHVCVYGDNFGIIEGWWRGHS